MKEFVPLVFYLLGLTTLNSQVSGRMIHALQIGSADNAVLLTGASSQFANPAGILSAHKTWDFGLTVHQRYHSDIRSISGVASRSFGKYGIGFGVSRYGIDEFNESQLSLSFARQLGKDTYLGLQSHVYQFRIEGLGQKSEFDMSLGFWHESNDRWTFSVYLLNPYLRTRDNIDRPGKIDLGAGLTISAQLKLFSSVSKPWGETVSFRPGIQYTPVEELSAIVAYNTSPESMNFGLIFHRDTIRITFGYHAHPFLGNALALGLGTFIQN